MSVSDFFWLMMLTIMYSLLIPTDNYAVSLLVPDDYKSHRSQI